VKQSLYVLDILWGLPRRCSLLAMTNIYYD
jgi:hypothetical protein